MIRDLLTLRGIETTIDWTALGQTLEEIESFRNKLAHGVWVRHPGAPLPVLQDLRGKIPGELDPTHKKAVINPRSVETPIDNLRDWRKAIDNQIRVIEKIRKELKPLLRS